MTAIVSIGEAALPAVLALNNLHAEELSLLDAARLSHLVRQAFHARVIGEADAFLIAFDEGADYDSENYAWFRRHYPRFVYVDRVAVAAAARGRGLARALYEDVFAAARAAGHDMVVAEVNDEPPNPASHAFHAALGFREVGSAFIHGGRKQVRYYARPLSDAAAA